MNYNHLSDDELLDYLDRYSEDPVMKRIVDILVHKQYGIISDLVAAGMDPQDWTFSSDNYNHYYPGQYVTHLKNEISYIEDELAECQDKYQDALDEITKLKARTVVELMLELTQEIADKDSDLLVARQERDRAIINERRTKEQMKVWTALSTDMSKK
jgi:hypothetical protein